MFQRITPVIKNLMIINAIVFVMLQIMMNSGIPYWRYFPIYTVNNELFQPFQFVTNMFTHFSISHIFFNMLGLYFFGPVIEQRIGEKKTVMAYILGGLLSGIAYFVYFSYFNVQNTSAVGASGALYTVLVLTAMYYPKMKVQLLFPPIPLTMTVLVAIYIGVDLYSMFTGARTGIAHLAHLGGAAMGFILYYYWEKVQR